MRQLNSKKVGGGGGGNQSKYMKNPITEIGKSTKYKETNVYMSEERQ